MAFVAHKLKKKSVKLYHLHFYQEIFLSQKWWQISLGYLSDWALGSIAIGIGLVLTVVLVF